MKLMTIIMIPFFIFIIFFLIFFKGFLNKEKLSPFECGFDPFSLSRIPFSLKFFLIAVIFLIFDIEIVIILPFPLLSFNKNMLFLITFIMINIFVAWGLIYEWKKGMLEWLK
uniref:NADH dehydrogenase subunit 3 n=1 Tax=Ixodes sinensis TaxID=339422 RepID=UPI001FAFB873|nr:NADH dehydrogenase subunit 3 [Ixodes sinensis]UNO53604.1 NADH dehydrogenase subunit 3 [Ixodes sinensis]UNO53682.1 NADH dehydrogenase subunit 3 [Ixodes sinensis]UNO53708.1 NADH dehydrogenase subunit 3 [Ixodes sinensis]